MKRLLLLLTIAAAGCSTASPPETTTSAIPEPTSVTSAVSSTSLPGGIRLPEALPDGIGVGTVDLDGRELVVALADTAVLRSQGLMNVDDLLDLDGMLFIFSEDGRRGFWMKNTLLPLDIAFFDVDGGFVDRLLMEPCDTGPCPIYRPGGEYRYALEMVAGTMPPDPQRMIILD